MLKIIKPNKTGQLKMITKNTRNCVLIKILTIDSCEQMMRHKMQPYTLNCQILKSIIVAIIEAVSLNI